MKLLQNLRFFFLVVELLLWSWACGQSFELKFFDNFVKQLYYMASTWSNISLESPVCTNKKDIKGKDLSCQVM